MVCIGQFSGAFECTYGSNKRTCVAKLVREGGGLYECFNGVDCVHVYMCSKIGWGPMFFIIHYMVMFMIRATRALCTSATPNHGKQTNTKAKDEDSEKKRQEFSPRFMKKH